jgi:hypothetical protein
VVEGPSALLVERPRTEPMTSGASTKDAPDRLFSLRACFKCPVTKPNSLHSFPEGQPGRKVRPPGVRTMKRAGTHNRPRKTVPRRCRQLFALLSDYLDGRLETPQCDELERHIHRCDPCQEFLVSLKSTVEACRRYQLDNLSPERATRMRRTLLAEYQRSLERAQTKRRRACTKVQAKRRRAA